MWSVATRKGEQPMRDVSWKTPLLNGDVQVLFQGEARASSSSADQSCTHPQQYYLWMWNESDFEPMAQLEYDFDVRRHLAGFDRVEDEVGNTDPLCGLFRKEGIDQKPLFQRGYAAAFLPYERLRAAMDGFRTAEWRRGNSAGQDDRWLRDGYVNTGRYLPNCMEPIDRVKWLL